MIEIKNLTVHMRDKTVIQSINCQIGTGHITLFIGESGAGKTSLLKAIVGLYPISEGTILIDEKDIKNISSKERAELIGYVFQEFNLFTHLTVLENCIDPLLVHGYSYDQACEQAYAYLEKLGVDACARQYPATLSGGQQQRVALARSLCLRPQVLLLDEPTASLDPQNRAILITILLSLKQEGLAVVASSQDMDFVRALFDHVYFVEKGSLIEFCDNRDKLEISPRIHAFIKQQ